jgi:hypothetical protein
VGRREKGNIKPQSDLLPPAKPHFLKFPVPPKIEIQAETLASIYEPVGNIPIQMMKGIKSWQQLKVLKSQSYGITGIKSLQNQGKPRCIQWGNFSAPKAYCPDSPCTLGLLESAMFLVVEVNLLNSVL